MSNSTLVENLHWPLAGHKMDVNNEKTYWNNELKEAGGRSGVALALTAVTAVPTSERSSSVVKVSVCGIFSESWSGVPPFRPKRERKPDFGWVIVFSSVLPLMELLDMVS
jgi:hypothetical protein